MARVLIPTAAIATFALTVTLASGALAPAAASSPDGQSLFAAKCKMCHTVDKGGHSMIGPNLYGVVGRKAASEPGFMYSQALRKSGLTWTTANLEAWVTSPQKLVPGNRMPFAGDHSPAEVKAIVDYLATLK